MKIHILNIEWNGINILFHQKDMSYFNHILKNMTNHFLRKMVEVFTFDKETKLRWYTDYI